GEVTAQPVALKWNNADLNYLLSILYPDLVLANRFAFSPPLEAIAALSGPINFKLYVSNPVSPTPSGAFSRTSPIGTGRPIRQTLLAESAPGCKDWASARKTLAECLLEDLHGVDRLCARYGVFSSLLCCPDWRLKSLLRGMQAMGRVDEPERWNRAYQLREVDEGCDLEARVEAYLLCAGLEEVGSCVGVVETVLGLGWEDRERMVVMYGEAGWFLRMAVCGRIIGGWRTRGD
ncbi:hypothetical protein K469DRAFT_796285, partial [Zopfia rhizophila CBS 207.26]